MMHHRKNVLEKTGRMRVLFCVRKCMVQSVHNRVSFGNEVRRSLRNVRHEMKNTLPELVHGEHFMRGITMVIERLNENGSEPMGNEKVKDWHEKGLC